MDIEQLKKDHISGLGLAEVEIDELFVRIDELADFCIWLTGCGYEFTQHKYFNEQRDKLLIGFKTQSHNEGEEL
jgi:hypothetical protein